MNINQELVEKITRLVLSKLQESNESLPGPLSEEELKRWQDVSLLLHGEETVSLAAEEANQLRSLTSEELQQWERISASLKATEPTANISYENTNMYTPQVKFHRVYS
jgi:hypothetical protein